MEEQGSKDTLTKAGNGARQLQALSDGPVGTLLYRSTTHAAAACLAGRHGDGGKIDTYGGVPWTCLLSKYQFFLLFSHPFQFHWETFVPMSVIHPAEIAVVMAVSRSDIDNKADFDAAPTPQMSIVGSNKNRFWMCFMLYLGTVSVSFDLAPDVDAALLASFQRLMDLLELHYRGEACPTSPYLFECLAHYYLLQLDEPFRALQSGLFDRAYLLYHLEQVPKTGPTTDLMRCLTHLQSSSPASLPPWFTCGGSLAVAPRKAKTIAKAGAAGAAPEVKICGRWNSTKGCTDKKCTRKHRKPTKGAEETAIANYFSVGGGVSLVRKA